jgi:hypothetical protein
MKRNTYEREFVKHCSLIDERLFDLLTDQNTNNNESNNETLLADKLKIQSQTQICEN